VICSCPEYSAVASITVPKIANVALGSWKALGCTWLSLLVLDPRKRAILARENGREGGANKEYQGFFGWHIQPRSFDLGRLSDEQKDPVSKKSQARGPEFMSPPKLLLSFTPETRNAMTDGT